MAARGCLALSPAGDKVVEGTDRLALDQASTTPVSLEELRVVRRGVGVGPRRFPACDDIVDEPLDGQNNALLDVLLFECTDSARY